MRWIFNLAHFAFFLIVLVHSVQDPYQNQPRIIVEEGHLVFQTGINNDISFRSYGSGKIRINNEDMQDLVRRAQSSVAALEQFRTIDATAITNQLEQLKTRLDDMDTIMNSFRELQSKVNNITLMMSRISGDGRRPWSLSKLTRKVLDINRNLSRLSQTLNRDECLSNPCQNGGTCIDSYNGFTCQCTDNWQGSTCTADVDECLLYSGTHLGCQNGATCVNKPGGYECHCAPSWHGVNCNTKHDDCVAASQDNRGLCLNGYCVSQPRTRPNEPNYKCSCDPGWTTNNYTGVCDIDINECDPNGPPHCSTNPRVPCTNTLGGFHCGHCPPGYEGNGQSCYDINECINNNGGCSLVPYVSCENTVGSFRCGRCPPGYVGDGKNCVPGVCSLRNGDCHPLATCIENNAVYAGYRDCRCPNGFSGDGIGPNGCQPMQPGQQGTACDSNPCIHGSCRAHANSFSCICYPGHTGTLCDQSASICASNPCKNGGTCIDRQESFTCNCMPSWQGPTCEQEVQNCGGGFVQDSGIIRYPLNTDQQYPHSKDCYWSISTSTTGKVLSLSFTFVQLEHSADCRFDFVQVNDGDTMSSPVLQRFCGSIQGQILTSTHGYVYLWFHSDATVNADGFEMLWNTTDPVCGGNVTAPHGTITSPGYPDKYPNSRDCFWYLQVLPGKRIQLQFSHVAIETHNNCSFDFVRVYDGGSLRSPLLETYCNSTVPEPLTTSGTHAIIHFHTDHSMSDKGFNLVYSSVPGVPGCGGTLTTDRGVIVSPNYPNRYLNHMNCEWLIRVHPDEKIELTFEEFHLERHSRCRWDYIEIHDGKDENANLLGRFCGRIIPPKLISSSNALWLKFVSDSSLTRDGFKAQYITTCGGLYSSPTGIIQSPFFPDSYPASRVCSYSIQIPIGYLVHLEFLHFDIEGDNECQYDCLEVLDNGSPNGTTLAHLCGDSIPDPVTSTYNHLLVVFRTDSSVQNQGFQANYSGIETGCGGVLTERNGVLTTPVHPSSYPHGVVCNWLIRAPEGFVVQLAFNFFDVEANENCTFDYVEIKDSDYHMLGRYCGTRKPPTMTSFDRELYVKFSADESVSRDGFSASYIMQDYRHNCGGNYKRAYGVIKSPGFPNHYPHNRECVWTLEVPVGRQIRLNFSTFSLETATNCRFDSLEIRNGISANAPLIGKFCGSTIRPNPIISHHHQLYLKFTTDGSSTDLGFNVTYDSASTGCGGILTSETGTIQSPSYPSPYSNNAVCQWTIRVARGSKITLVLVDLDVEPDSECEFDYIRVFDGSDDRAQALTPKLCNTRQNPGTIVSSQNVLHIIFRTDPSVNGRGFSLAYHANCNNVLKGIRGVIESPNFPSLYPHNYNCTWEIQAPEGNNVSIAFSALMLENDTNCQYDKIEILQQLPPKVSDSEPVQGPQSVAKYCGTPSPLPQLMINASRIFVRFMSDDSQSQRGFRLEYALKGCVGEFRKNRGSIQTPNYPNGYPANLRCEWHIITDPGTHVVLNVENMDIEGNTLCYFDSLKVFDGLDEKSNLLHTFCHKSDMISTASTGNKMMLRFSSDHTVNLGGFRVSYYAARDCEFDYRGASQGTIVSKNYPNNFPNGTICSYNIQVHENHLVQIDFQDFDMPSDPGCVKNYIQVVEGERRLGNREILFKHCGPQLPANYTPIVSKGANVRIEIVTSDNKTARGFKATFTAVCGAVIKVEGSGYLTSPNYPHGSVNIYNCSWVLSAPEGDSVSLTFVEMMVHNSENCSKSFLDVRDGHTQDAPLIRRFCGHSIPPPITSRGNNLFVYLQNYGTFKAAYTNSISACGASLLAPEGTFNSPSYPASYPPSSSCEWTINSAPGNRIELSFTLFMLEENENCNTDYLEIHENGPDGRSFGRFCGNDVPVNITAVNKLWIKFRSDDSGTGVGFQANYMTIHGIDLTGNVGEVASPMFPLKNLLSGTYTWTITVDQTLYVSLEFLTFSMIGNGESNEICHSYLEVFDGSGDQATPLRERLCGITLPEPIVASTNVVTLKYVTIGYRRSHFHLRWTGVNSTFIATPPPPTSYPGVSCGEEVFLNHSSNVTVTSPGYPHSYDNNLNCSWIFMTVPGRKVDMVINASLDFRYCGDSISVYDALFPGSSWQISPEGNICGVPFHQQRLNISSAFRTGTRLRKVVFNTDAYNIRSDYVQGFSLFAYDECGGTLTGSNGYLDHSLGFRRNGTGPCQWLIQVRRGRTIKITFEIFNIPSTLVSCSPRYLYLRNGGYADSPDLGAGKFCGQNIPLPIVSSSNKVHVTLQARGGNQAPPEFKLRYQELSLGCGGEIHLSLDNHRETITSPNYPNDPPHDVQCEWIVFSPPGTAIRLDIENLSFESGKCSLYRSNSSNYLEAYDGGTVNAHKLGRYCDAEYHESLRATGNVMFLRFVSSDDVAHAHFTANVTIAECGGIVRSPSTISSPNYPQRSDKKLDCEWLVKTVHEQFAITGNFTRFDLPDNTDCSRTDHVEVRALSSTGPVIGRYCGQRNQSRVSDFIAEYPQIYVKYHSNGNASSATGFSLRLSNKPICLQNIYGPSGTIESPGFPRPHPFARTCRYSFYVNIGKRIRLTFNNFNLPRDPITGNCTQYIKITRGALYRNQSEVPLCGNVIQSIESFSNVLYLILVTTTGLGQGEGFRATYTTDLTPFCEDTITGSEGSLASYVFQPREAYIYYTQCRHNIDADTEFDNVTVALRLRDMSNGNDTICNVTMLMIRGTNQRSEICTMPETELLFAGPRLTVAGHTREFSDLRYNISYKTYECGGYYTAPVVITSPNFPGNYPNDSRCAWIVSTDTAYGEQLQVTISELPRLGGTCQNTNLTIREGQFYGAPITALYCSGAVPPPLTLTASSHTVEVIFSSDGMAASDRGFNLTIDVQRRGCGGTHTRGNDYFTSPNYPLEYPNNTQCEWLISLASYNRVNISFTGRFDIENTTNCVKDSLLIEEQRSNVSGGIKTWQTIERLCGHQTRNSIISTTNEVRVTFTSDNAIQGDGFNLIYKGVCGSWYTDPSGTLSSPGFPTRYENNLECRYLIGSKSNDYVSFKFDTDTFDIERVPSCIYDSVTIYRGNDTNVAPLGVFCGQPEEDRETIIRNKGPLLVVFKTDDSVGLRGFMASYNISTCGGNLTDTQGIITSPFYPNLYNKNTRCDWLITVPPEYDIQFRVLDIELEGSSNYCTDFLQVRDGNSTGSDVIGTYCDNTVKKVIKSSGNQLFVRFHSDYSVEYGGFQAIYKATRRCGGFMDRATGSISSPDFDNDGKYDKDLDCVWRVRGTQEKVIKISFESFQVTQRWDANNTERCSTDYLEIRDGISLVSPLVGRYCGSSIPDDLKISSNTLLLHFHSDMDDDKLSGFRLYFSSENPICGGLLNISDLPQTLTSPNYPNYLSNVRCRWQFVSNQTLLERMEISINDFDIPCDDAYLDVFVGRNSHIRYGPMTADHLRFCGEHYFLVTYAIRLMSLEFHSGSSANHRGFSLTYKRSNCSRNYTEDNGFIYSPDISGNNRIECMSVITAQPGRTISLYFLEFFNRIRGATNCNNQFLRIRDGTNESAPLLSEVCAGRALPSPIFTSGETAFIHYFRAQTFSNLKYTIAYTTTDQGQGCGGNLHGYVGAFYSPFYPNPVNRTETCIWKISVLPQHTMTLHVIDFRLTSELGCDSNYLEIYNGRVENPSGLISRFCGDDNPGTINSQTNEILAKLVTNSNNTDRGFKIVYTMNTVDLTKPSEIDMNMAEPSTVPTRGAVLDTE